ncbi:hypothetical protein CHS0354_035734 [Potamilus streckersoni]|uniref:Uncharacterized protein n=1 Tax=Potamilus streckersoni TaxID=2493646 RepID=A0AAE0S075_9BIVA|nr:hypothetical protein CHS0354_035734 [Potamilus streckersoni]
MKSVIILCCIALAKGHFGYSFGSRGFPFGIGPMSGGTTVVAGPTSIGFSRGHSLSTQMGTVSTAVGKGLRTATNNARKILKVGPITSVTGPLGSNNPTPGFSGSNRLGVDYNPAFRGYGPWGGQGIGGNPDVVATGAAISARENAASIAFHSRNSGQHIGTRSSGTGRPIWTPHGQIRVADSVSSFVRTGFDHIPYGGKSVGLGEESDFGSGISSGGDDFLIGGIGG